MIFLYPADYFDSSIADDFFDTERRYALSLGHDVALFDFDDCSLISCTNHTAYQEAEEITLPCQYVIYRGWQMPVDRYEQELFPLLQELGEPITSPEEYAVMHSSDRYLPYIEHLLPDSINISYDEMSQMDHEEKIEMLSGIFDALGNKVFVKDYVKSVYGKNQISRNSENPEGIESALDILEQIREDRGDSFAGGFTFKEWIDFSEQVRLFVLNGRVVAAMAHDGIWSGNIPDNVPVDLPSVFYTVDMAFSPKHGRWFVVECGDGQVSECDDENEMHKMYFAFLDLS